MYGLTSREQYILAAAYSDGVPEEELAERLGCSRQAVAATIRRASDKLARQGLPRPRPYGRGSRAELREIFPPLAGV
jgi:DNA-directed RNA polymerase specialized sigma24 family protein